MHLDTSLDTCAVGRSRISKRVHQRLYFLEVVGMLVCAANQVSWKVCARRLCPPHCVLAEAPLPDNTTTTDSSAAISWSPPPNSSLPDSYSIVLSNSLNQNHTAAVIQAPGTGTRVEFEGLLSQQSYHYCVIAVYDVIAISSFCRSLQTAQSSSSPTPHTPYPNTPHPNTPHPTPLDCSTLPTTDCSCSETTKIVVMGVLASAIAVLLLLLVLAVVGLAYYRSKVKEKPV